MLFAFILCGQLIPKPILLAREDYDLASQGRWFGAGHAPPTRIIYGSTEALEVGAF